LVIVLGFLTILVILGLGFAVSMRVERLVSRSALDHIRAKQLAEASLARAVEDLDENIGSDVFARWSGDWAGGVFESVGAGPLANAQLFLSGHITNYIPLSLWDSAVAAAQNANWLSFSYSGRTVGRYAYVTLDCSGLIDINMDYSQTNNLARPRLFGSSPYELQLTNALLREVRHLVADVRVWTNLIFSRLPNHGQTITKPWYRIETLPEINPLLSRGIGFNGLHPLGDQTVNGTNSVNFVTYSRYPAGYLETGVIRTQTYVGGSTLDLISNRSRIENAFASMGVPNPAVLFDNLFDYVDPGNIPQSLTNFCTEAVPLINEIVVSNRVIEGATHVTNELQVLVEVWYPFTGTNNNSYTIQIDGAVGGAFPIPLGPSLLTNYVDLPPGPWTAGRISFITSRLASASTTGSYDLTSSYFQGRIRVREGGAGGPAVDESRVRIEIGELHGGAGAYQRGLAANDPRLNWNSSVAGQWTDRLASQLTLGATNEAVLTASGPNADGHTLMYVANRPLESVGELELLLYDSARHWQTISLLDGANFFPVLDRFAVSSSGVRHGLINPNSHNAGVVGTAFFDMPVERVPFDPSPNTNFARRLTADQARALGLRFANKNIAITNLSDLRFIRPQILSSMTLSNVSHESVIRNSAGLFSPRQQLFTVLVAAQVLQENTTNVLAEQRGVGLVWRDPYPVNGRHETRVRNFRWLTE
jgi:hypothetical protein